MPEQELKLHVPLHSRNKIRKVLEKASRISLRAMYFDTCDRQLAKAKVAIRLRQEGDDWIQTLKMAGTNSLSRIEINHTRSTPILDLSLYAGTAAEPILACLNKPLELRYETNVIRLFKTQRTRSGRVEIAYDTGFIRAGRLELPINEVEFELKSGDIQSIFDIGLRWIKQYDLIVDMRTKSHRGDALASMMSKINDTDEEFKQHIEEQETSRFWAKRKAKPYAIAKHLSATQALCHLTEECIEQIALNAAYLTDIDTAGIISIASPEHVHQLRVGMRRLISNWHLFKGTAHLPSIELQTQLRQFLAQFGETRDSDVLFASIMPLLKKAGMPTIEIDSHPQQNASEIAKGNEFQAFLVNLLAWVATAPTTDPVNENKSEALNKTTPLVHETTAPTNLAIQQSSITSEIPIQAIAIGTIETQVDVPATHIHQHSGITTNLNTESNIPTMNIIPLVPSKHTQQGLRKTLEKRLNKWNKAIISYWKHHDRQQIESYHDLRKRIKRMRYGLNVYEGLEGHASVNTYIKQLSRAQTVFGYLNDHATALAFFKSITDKHPEAWFAVGWLSSQLVRLKHEADIVLKRLPKKISFL